MRDRSSDTTEYQHNWDDGTYQTGPTRIKRGRSGLVMVLLVAVIFLGGIASALGIMNIQLLKQLAEESQELYLSAEGDTAGEEVPAATRPEMGQLTYERQSDHPLTEQQLMENGNACMVSLTVLSVDGTVEEGKGLVITSSGYIVTDASLVGGGMRITATLSDGEEMDATLVASDVYSDLAVLYVAQDDLQAASFSTEVASDEAIYIIREDDLQSGTADMENTGSVEDAGPIFNQYGQVVGYQSRAQVFSAQQMVDILTQLTQTGHVSGHPRLGFRIKEMTNFYLEYWNLEQGLLVCAITDDESSLARELMQGDVLLGINGEALSSAEQLYTAIAQAEAGDMLEFEVFRAGNTFTLEVEMEYHP